MQGFTIVFDLDGTLVDTAPDLIGATNHALSDIGLEPVTGDLLRPWISFGARRMIVEALRSKRAGINDSEVDRLLSLFLGYYEANIARESRPYPGMLNATRALIEAGAQLAVCTNKRQTLSDLLLKELGLSGLFHTVAGRDAFPVCKPHPDHLLGTIARAGGHPDRAIMVGDSEVDIATAKAAGVPVVAVSFGYSQVPVSGLDPDALIDHYDQLAASLTPILERGIQK
jgi:phosphoglycolate phosphatase